MTHRCHKRELLQAKDFTELREPAAPYSGNFDGENGPLSIENTCFGGDIV